MSALCQQEGTQATSPYAANETGEDTIFSAACKMGSGLVCWVSAMSALCQQCRHGVSTVSALCQHYAIKMGIRPRRRTPRTRRARTPSSLPPVRGARGECVGCPAQGSALCQHCVHCVGTVSALYPHCISTSATCQHCVQRVGTVSALWQHRQRCVSLSGDP